MERQNRNNNRKKLEAGNPRLTKMPEVSLKELRAIALADPEKVRQRLGAALKKAGSIKALAELLSCSQYSVRVLLSDLDIPTHERSERAKPSQLREVTDEEWTNSTDMQIALKYGCTIWNIRKYRYRWKISRQQSNGQMRVLKSS